MTMEKLGQNINQLSDTRDAVRVRTVLEGVYKRLGTFAMSSAGLAIGTTKPKITSATDYYAWVGGLLVKKAATVDLITLTTASNCANALFNVTVFTINSAGTITNRAGTAGATLATVTWPVLPNNEAVFGILVVNPTGTGGFVGGTTDLDDATVVPNAKYLNPLGAGSYSAFANL